MRIGTSESELLLVEDDPTAARLFVERLHHFAPGEFEVTQARSLATGLEAASDGNFGLAVLDLTLPDASGLETCSRFSSAQPDTPFIVLTGVADASLAETLSAAGARAALLKQDCDGPDLVNAIRASMDRDAALSPEVTRRVAEARFRNAIVDNADGVVVVDESGKIVLVSSGAESLLGRSAAELTGSPLGVELKPGKPVRAQVVREESGQAEMPSTHDTVRHFDVCKLRISEIEFWSFDHHWSGKPVTVCALRDVTKQSVEESRQRGVAMVDEQVEISAGIESICTDIAVRLGSLMRFNRFEVAVWRPEWQRLQLIAELGTEAAGRTVSSMVTADASPPGFSSWSTGWSMKGSEPRVAVSVGSVNPGVYDDRDLETLNRSADVIASALAAMRRTPALTSLRRDAMPELDGAEGLAHEATR